MTAVQLEHDNRDAKDRSLHFPVWKYKVTTTNGSPGKTCVGQAIQWDPDPTREVEWSCQDNRLAKDARHGSNIWAVQCPHTFCPGDVPHYNGIKAKGYRCFNHVHHKTSWFPVGMIPTGTEFF